MSNTTETQEVPGARAASCPTLRLLFSGQALVSGVSRALRGGELSIGREAAGPGDLAIAGDGRMSRIHARLVRDGGELRVIDCGSKNGTFVGGRRVAEAPLREGDVLRVGDSFLLLRSQPAQALDARVPSIVGQSPAAARLRHALGRVGQSAATVLLLGESGTGKEVCARALHELSGRPGPFVAVNCAAIPESLAESQLFGHTSGAFTGAKEQLGLFRAAQGGTLLLDEVGELSPAIQAKLLRVVEERAVTPVGAARALPCDVRLVAATHRDLGADVDAGRFRGDLYARLCEAPVDLPPLRERREDVLLLLAHALGAAAPRLTARLVEALLLHPFRFNVREVFKIAGQLRLQDPGPDAAFDLDEGAQRLLRQAPAPAAPAAAAPATTADAASDDDEPEGRAPAPTRAELEALLTAHRGNISHLARAVGRSRRQVDRWLAQHGLDPAAFRR